MRSRTYQFLLASALGLGLSVIYTKAAVYQEVGGQVVVEAVHFDYRNFEFTDKPIPHHFHIVPDEDNVTSAAHPWGDTGSNPSDPNGLNQFANSRTGHYLQIVPDIGDMGTAEQSRAAGNEESQGAHGDQAGQCLHETSKMGPHNGSKARV